MAAKGFAELLQEFFLSWLRVARRASENTVDSYRYAFELFLAFMSSEQCVGPSAVSMSHVERGNVLEFLSWLEEERGNSPKTVNCRLAALKSFCSFAAYRRPDLLEQLTAVRELPQRRERLREVDYLTPDEVGWLLDACEPGSERRLMLALLYNTGCRVSELLHARARDVTCGGSGRARVHVVGKGRKDRTLPLWEDVSEALRAHVGGLGPDDHLFAGRGVPHLTRSGARHRVDAAYDIACGEHPELAGRKVGPHTFRHSCAMAMLAAGVDIATVAIWLGHESVNTTHRYVVLDMRLKEEALEKVRRSWELEGTTRPRYKAEGDVLDFLRSL